MGIDIPTVTLVIALGMNGAAWGKVFYDSKKRSNGTNECGADKKMMIQHVTDIATNKADVNNLRGALEQFRRENTAEHQEICHRLDRNYKANGGCHEDQ